MLGFYLPSRDAMMHRVFLSRLVEFFLFRTFETKGIYHIQASRHWAGSTGLAALGWQHWAGSTGLAALG
jgi:hypothetical protein